MAPDRASGLGAVVGVGSARTPSPYVRSHRYSSYRRSDSSATEAPSRASSLGCGGWYANRSYGVAPGEDASGEDDETISDGIAEGGSELLRGCCGGGAKPVAMRLTITSSSGREGSIDVPKITFASSTSRGDSASPTSRT
jgi:hypothetical protein